MILFPSYLKNSHEITTFNQMCICGLTGIHQIYLATKSHFQNMNIQNIRKFVSEQLNINLIYS